MAHIERKKVANKAFFYLTEQIRIGRRSKKIQVYIGKTIPTDMRPLYAALARKECALRVAALTRMYTLGTLIPRQKFEKAERVRTLYKYRMALLSEEQRERAWRAFAIHFIFESNAIEGSQLSQKEVASIVEKRYVKKKLNRREVQEVENSIAAFRSIQKSFIPNERSIIALHTLLVRELGIPVGYKKHSIVVNNTETTPPGEVRARMAGLLRWWRTHKKSRIHPLILAAIFHQRFELIHPFEDSNGRVGRLLFVWMLYASGYGAILFKKRNRRAYFSALQKADEGRPRNWHLYCLDAYARTMREQFDIQ